MPTNTYVALDKITVGTATATVTFSSIPQGYTDLVLIVSAKTNTTAAQIYMTINGDAGSNYSRTILYGTGSAAGSARNSNQTVLFADYYGIMNTTDFNMDTFHFMNYSNTTTYKTVLSRTNLASSGIDAMAHLWRSTSAITSILVGNYGYNFSVGSTFSLYGIASAEVGAKATGGTVTSDANYYYHTFLASGTFTPTQSLTCDYLVVAGGGGGGGYNAGGGGGAGGLRSTVGATGGGGTLETPLSLSATGYTVTVGAGGAGASNTAIAGTVGANSVFSTITSTAGGGGSGGGASNVPGSSGGSGGGGGGGGGTPSVTNSGSSGTTNQGYAGGTGQYGSTWRSAGGGGGAGAVGANGDGSNVNGAGAGGIGVQITALATITGTGVSNYYAGGGAGGADGSSTARAAGGTGGGGAGGGNGLAASAGTANTGAGGGGGGGNVNGSAAGGSGIVIVRYAK